MLLAGGCCVVNLASTGRGGPPPAQGAVVVAMETKFEPMPLASTLVGEADELAKAVAQHVAKRTHLQCVVTASLPEHASLFVADITGHVHRAVLAALEHNKSAREK